MKRLVTTLSIAFLSICMLAATPLYANPPEQSGPYVYRGQNNLFYFFSNNGMVAFVGIDIPKACADEWLLDSWDWLSVLNPSGIELWMDKIKGDDVVTFVYPETAFFDDDGFDFNMLCDFDRDYGEIASGTSDVLIVDNDALAGLYDRNRAHSLKLSAHGVLYTQSDDPVMFKGGFHCVVKKDPDNSAKNFDRCTGRLTLGE